LSRQASGRHTEPASVLERFLDDETDNLSTNLFDGLEEVAESIDEMVNEILGVLQDTQEDLETLKSEKAELEARIQELEEA
jgi:peptidoglycan hydrolase CwlO-like protein